jgi:flavin-binding protein dodecin
MEGRGALRATEPIPVRLIMAIVKVIELIAQSEKGFDDAVKEAVKEASKTVKGIRSVWVDNFSAEVEAGKVTLFRVNAKVSFVLKDR